MCGWFIVVGFNFDLAISDFSEFLGIKLLSKKANTLGIGFLGVFLVVVDRLVLIDRVLTVYLSLGAIFQRQVCRFRLI